MIKNVRNMINLVMQERNKASEVLAEEPRTSVVLGIYLICFSVAVVAGGIQMHRSKEPIYNIQWFWILKKLFLVKMQILRFRKKRNVIHVMVQVQSLEQK